MKKTAPALFLPALLALAIAPIANAGFEWKVADDSNTDLLLDDKNVARYVHPTLDDSSKETREATYKPFHHVYDEAGKDFLTKGPGGKFTHHRGIYFGFSKCKYTTPEGKEVVVDTWHCKPPAYQNHKEVVEQSADDKQAKQVLKIDWHGADGKVFAHETRSLTFSKNGDALVVDFSSSVKAADGIKEVVLDGDPQHAGFQFRASNEVSEKTNKQTYYIRPGSGKADPGTTINWSAKTDTEATRDLPWKAMSFVVGGERYTTVYLDHPTNPKPARYSERDYGRFGSYFVASATADKPVEVNYRLVIQKGEIEAADAEALSAAFVK
jgi:hypothetical protein